MIHGLSDYPYAHDDEAPRLGAGADVDGSWRAESLIGFLALGLHAPCVPSELLRLSLLWHLLLPCRVGVSSVLPSDDEFNAWSTNVNVDEVGSPGRLLLSKIMTIIAVAKRDDVKVIRLL